MRDKFKQRLIEIAVEIDRVCRENNLRYFLMGGSLLGAIRHDGIIPWDDDIDIAMPREDYEKLRKISQTAFQSRFRFATHDLDKDYPYFYAKVFHQETTFVELEDPFYLGGVFVDVFPIDGLPSNRFLMNLHYKRFYFWRKICKYTTLKKMVCDGSRFKQTMQNVAHRLINALITNTFAISQCDRVAKKYLFDDCEYVANLCGAYGKKEITLKTNMDTYKEHVFEGYNLLIPEGYENILTKTYGDYMQLPPEEKRVSRHNHFYLNLDKRITRKEDVYSDLSSCSDLV